MSEQQPVTREELAEMFRRIVAWKKSDAVQAAFALQAIHGGVSDSACAIGENLNRDINSLLSRLDAEQNGLI